ncbi:glycosyltransferase family 4 protein [uncultured Gemmiger sp.]|uniref:glycosyltransferase family 4 protein n=1 Tax=uncultured Gemmiger sp. TaxID=1623490 RepID=UPI0025D6037F|nr:glycosyltransferase family 4 protein [uncultured Gemmiger sp.]
MKKIDIITRAMTSGGAERVIAQLANYFTEKDISCRIITTENGEVMYPLHEKIDIVAIGKKSNNKVIDRILRYKTIRIVVQKNKPDVVLTMPEDTGIYAILALIGTGIPVYVSERNNPWVMPDVKITRLLRKVAYPFAQGIIFQTQMAKSFFPQYIQKKGVVLQNPVDATRIPEPYIGERKKVFSAVGRLEPQKNFPMLIRAFSEFHKREKDYKLVIYGEGRERINIENLIKELHLENSVSLPGRNKDVLNCINDCAAFILSSDYEGMPNALIEAMCMGMPVISTDCPSGGPREIIENEKNGLLIPVNDELRMTQAMFNIIKDGDSCLLGQNAYKIGKHLMDASVFEDWKNVLINE